MLVLDLVADLNCEDDEGLNWALLRNAAEPGAVVPGAVLRGHGACVVVGADRRRRLRRHGPLPSDLRHSCEAGPGCRRIDRSPMKTLTVNYSLIGLSKTFMRLLLAFEREGLDAGTHGVLVVVDDVPEREAVITELGADKRFAKFALCD